MRDSEPELHAPDVPAEPPVYAAVDPVDKARAALMTARSQFQFAVDEQQEAAAASATANDALRAVQRRGEDAAPEDVEAARAAVKSAERRVIDAKSALTSAQLNLNAAQQAFTLVERDREFEQTHLTPKSEAGGDGQAQAKGASDAAARVERIRGDLRARRRRRAAGMGVRLAAFVGAPTLLAAFYFFVIASNFYQSEAVVTIRAPDNASVGSDVGSLLGQSASLTMSQDSVSVMKYVLSRDVLRRLDIEQGMIAHYQSEEIDSLSRLAADASFEDAFAYYERVATVEFDPLEGVLTLSVTAASAEAAQRFVRSIIAYSEEKVNQLTQRVYEGQVASAERDVAKAETRMKAARERFSALQQRMNRLDPTASAEGALGIITSLQGELTAALVERNSLIGRGLSPSAPKIRGLNEQIRSLEAQIAASETALVNAAGGVSLGEAIAQFDAAKFDEQIATKTWESALLSLENAKSEALRQHRYLAVVVEPSLPDKVTHPRRLQNTFLALLIALCAYGLLSLTFTVVREHAYR